MQLITGDMFSGASVSELSAPFRSVVFLLEEITTKKCFRDFSYQMTKTKQNTVNVTDPSNQPANLHGGEMSSPSSCCEVDCSIFELKSTLKTCGTCGGCSSCY